ncbi:MAG: hypothetical protein B7X41_00130, partial [Microbacterium sp. 14-71-5]
MVLGEQSDQGPQVMVAGRHSGQDSGELGAAQRHLPGQHGREPFERLGTFGLCAGSVGAAAAARLTVVIARVRAPALAAPGTRVGTGSAGVTGGADQRAATQLLVRGSVPAALEAGRVDCRDRLRARCDQGADEPVQDRRPAGRADDQDIGVGQQVVGQLPQAAS